MNIFIFIRSNKMNWWSQLLHSEFGYSWKITISFFSNKILSPQWVMLVIIDCNKNIWVTSNSPDDAVSKRLFFCCHHLLLDVLGYFSIRNPEPWWHRNYWHSHFIYTELRGVTRHILKRCLRQRCSCGYTDCCKSCYFIWLILIILFNCYVWNLTWSFHRPSWWIPLLPVTKLTGTRVRVPIKVM